MLLDSFPRGSCQRLGRVPPGQRQEDQRLRPRDFIRLLQAASQRQRDDNLHPCMLPVWKFDSQRRSRELRHWNKPKVTSKLV